MDFPHEKIVSVKRAFKTAANAAAGEKKPEAYPLGYVEDFFEPRTKLAGVFSARHSAAILRQG